MKLDRLLGKRSVSEAQARFAFDRRSFVLGGAQLSIGALLAGRMAYLSIFENARYALLAESNRVNLSLIPPRRGWIVDRAGKPLALNRTVFRVDVIPDRLKERKATLDELQQLLGLTADERDRIERDIDKAAGFQPVQVAEKLDWQRYAALSIRAPDLPGVQPAQGFARYYPDGAAVGHLIGYVGAASAEDYAKSKDPLLIAPGYKIGKEALEKTMEPVLKGKPGARRSEVTARGKLVRDLATRPDVPGNTIRLTIDRDLQDYAARRMGDNSGAITVIDLATGGLAAMVSMPAYDPNSFSDGIGRREYAALTSDDHLPLVNKTLHALYPPGSTTKPSSALALLEAGIDPDETVFCGGAMRVGSAIFHCDKRHGSLALAGAVVHSCDIYFYTMGLKYGANALAGMFRKLGLGAVHPLPLQPQRFGTVPDPQWIERKHKRAWAAYDTVNMSIGQGYMLANPLQLAVMAARLATGHGLEPHLMGPPRPGAPLGVNPAHVEFVRQAMGNVVNGGGTAAAARLPIPGVQMAGKTGTAQVRRITLSERAGGVRSNATLPWKQRDHAHFIGFAPVESPRYAFSVLVEHGGFGAAAAAPIARDTMTFLFAPDQAMKSLTALEQGWGGDLATRMAAKAASYKTTPDPAPAPDTGAPSDVPAPPDLAPEVTAAR
ncbi:MAG: penicillin-binding protein 2 [Sphingomonadaceae bacterium]|nr:penicillin-binding protein 2 [Sphingomonadaceae bacterium]